MESACQGLLCSSWACLPRQTISIRTTDTDAFRLPETMDDQQAVGPITDTCDDRGTYVPPDYLNAAALPTSMVVNQRPRAHGKSNGRPLQRRGRR